MIRGSVDGHDKSIPTILEIPRKEHPYDATKDSILRRARVSIEEKHANSLLISFF
jgi:V-type H+-transporting ATPase subunit F